MNLFMKYCSLLFIAMIGISTMTGCSDKGEQEPVPDEIPEFSEPVSFSDVIGNQAVIGLKALSFCNIIICCLVGTMFYLKYLKGNRQNQTLSIESSKSNNVKAILFIIGSIISLCCMFIFIWAVNNGIILERS